MTARKDRTRVISIQRGQKVQFPVQADNVSATIDQIREIRTARYVDSFTGPQKDVILTLQMSDGVVSARPWQIVF